MYNLVENKDYRLYCNIDEMYQVNMHIDVKVWSPRVARQIALIFEEAKEALRLEGFNKIYTITPNPKFVRMVTTGGYTFEKMSGGVEVIVWDLGD